LTYPPYFLLLPNYLGHSGLARPGGAVEGAAACGLSSPDALRQEQHNDETVIGWYVQHSRLISLPFPLFPLLHRWRRTSALRLRSCGAAGRGQRGVRDYQEALTHDDANVKVRG